MNGNACARARKLLPFYTEGEVQPSEALHAAAHISACPDCAEQESMDRRVLSALRGISPPDPPRDIAANVIETLRRIGSGLQGRRALKWGSLGILAAVLLAGGMKPWSVPGVGLKILTRLGEAVHLDVLFERLIDFLSGLAPSPSGLLEFLTGGGQALAGGADPAIHQIAVFLLATVLCVAFLTGCLMLGGLLAARPVIALRRSRRGF